MGITAQEQAALAARLSVIFPQLDEQQRRLVAGAEARAIGHGGIRAVARAAGMREGTVSKGAAELESGDEPLGRVAAAGRRAEAGRGRGPGAGPGAAGAGRAGRAGPTRSRRCGGR